MFGWFTNPEAQANMNDKVHMVAPRTIMQWMSHDECVVIDVREPNEYVQAHIPGSILMPLSQFDPAKVPVDPAKKLVIHCRSGNRCGMAAARMMAAGFGGEIHRMEGGIMNWRVQGGTVESGA